jgi:hypothetical protein
VHMVDAACGGDEAQVDTVKMIPIVPQLCFSFHSDRVIIDFGPRLGLITGANQSSVQPTGVLLHPGLDALRRGQR